MNRNAQKEENKFNLAVVTMPLFHPRHALTFRDFMLLLEPLCEEIFLITGNFSYDNGRIHIIEVERDKRFYERPLWIKIPNSILRQLKICFYLIKISRNIDGALFFSGTRGYFLPILCLKLRSRKSALFLFGSAAKLREKTVTGLDRIISPVIDIAAKISLSLCDKIVMESPSNISFARITKYRNKISSIYAGPQYVHTDIFKLEKDLPTRRNLVGYIGRLSPEKGVLNFAKATPLIWEQCSDVRFLIVGDGPLLTRIKTKLKESKISDKVIFKSWCSQEELPEHLNELRLLVVPSYTEGLPSIVQEAMACGTPVLATPVGSIPDLIKDGETGFITENNSPGCIAMDVIRALDHPNLEGIARNAHELIEREYTHKAMVGKCKHVINELIKGEE